MQRFGMVTLAAASIAAAWNAEAGHSLSTSQAAILQQWLGGHSTYRLAEIDDCRCADDVANMRKGFGAEWPAVPDYNPYVATGDFNDDGKADFAVVLVEKGRKPNSFAFLVFNGPHAAEPTQPAFVETGRDLSRQGLFYGAPRPRPYRLLLGPFESEASILEPKGATYVWVYTEP